MKMNGGSNVNTTGITKTVEESVKVEDNNNIVNNNIAINSYKKLNIK